MSKRRIKLKMKLGFLIPTCVGKLAEEDPKLLEKMSVLQKAVAKHLAEKTAKDKCNR